MGTDPKSQTGNKSIVTKFNNPPSNFLQRCSIFATIFSSFLAFLLGIITLFLMIKYGENRDKIEKLINMSSKLDYQNHISQEHLSQLKSQTKFLTSQGLLQKTQIEIAAKQLKSIYSKDSNEKKANVVKFSNNYEVVSSLAFFIKDTTITRNWDNNVKYEILKNLIQNIYEGEQNPILIEDKISFDDWNSLFLQVSGLIQILPNKSQTFRYTLQGMNDDQREKFTDDVFIDIIKNCSSVSKKLFYRILCKYKYNAVC